MWPPHTREVKNSTGYEPSWSAGCYPGYMARRRLARPTASDIAEVARGKGTARDKAEVAAYRRRLGKTRRKKLR